jgi:hypothetical protein
MRRIGYGLSAVIALFVVLAIVVPGAFWAAFVAAIMLPMAASAFMFGIPHHDKPVEPAVEREATLVP